MKRTNVIVDEDLLTEACRITGERTWSGVINHALEEIIKRNKVQKLLDMAGTGFWQGDLAEMRGKKSGSPDDDVPWLTARAAGAQQVADRPGPEWTAPALTNSSAGKAAAKKSGARAARTKKRS